jgi:crotonobetainyl-CoA:carnitine CoA-transferase CaiB-like acyl-CoA transferase
MSPRIASYLAGDPEPEPCGGTDSVVAIYQRFETADRPLVVAVGNDRLWIKACAALGLDALGADPELATNAGRRARRDEVVASFQSALATMSSVEALHSLQTAGVPCSLIRSLSEVVDDPQVLARQAIVEQEHPVAGRVRLVSSPWLLRSMENARATSAVAPSRGEHGRQILLESGLADDQVDQLIEAGVVWAP